MLTDDNETITRSSPDGPDAYLLLEVDGNSGWKDFI
jgi:hypothetical protein